MSNASHRFDNAKRRRDGNHDRQRLLTPAYVLEPIRKLLGGIDLDPCTEADNPTGARAFYALPDDGLSLPWNGRNVFCNPPYGEARLQWIRRCVEFSSVPFSAIAHYTPFARRPSILLIPAATETMPAQIALRACSSVLFVQARLRFAAVRKNGRHEAASHPSMLLGFGIDLSPLAELGTVFAGPVAQRSDVGRVQ